MERYARGSAVAVIRLCNPPVNALRYRRHSAGNAGPGLGSPWWAGGGFSDFLPFHLIPTLRARGRLCLVPERAQRASAGTSTPLSTR